ncbi:hypothetical protein WL80_29785 [Burkholderia ubonensis]|nr:hypothetical protein WL80_29785 [Burkholderia ubonensis]
MDALAPPTPNDANPWRGLLAHLRRRVRDERRLAAGRERADVPPQLGEPMPRERRDAHVVRREHAFQQRTFVAPVRRSVARSESRPHRSSLLPKWNFFISFKDLIAFPSRREVRRTPLFRFPT